MPGALAKGGISMERANRPHPRLIRGAIASLVIGLSIASCGGDDDSTENAATAVPGTSVVVATTESNASVTTETTTGSEVASEQACADRDALRSSVAALADVDVVAQGTDGLTSALDAVKNDLAKVKASAGSAIAPEVQAVEDALAATETALTNVGNGGLAELSSALSNLSASAQTLLTSLEGGPCN
jgi:hypothetical protein